MVAVPGNESSHSSHSFASSLQSITPHDGEKRDRSPAASLIRSARDDVFKNPRSHREMIDDWNKEGTLAVHGFCENRRAHMKTQSDAILETWRTNLEQALANFRVQFNAYGRTLVRYYDDHSGEG